MFDTPSINIFFVSPAVIIALWGVLLMVVDLIVPRERQTWMPTLTIVGLVWALVQNFLVWGYIRNPLVTQVGTFIPQGSETPMVIADGYVFYLNLIFLITGILTVLISAPYLKQAKIFENTEYYMLLLFSISGMMLMGMANDLILVFIALELLSIPLYVMCGIARPHVESEESALKYFLLGAFASGFLVFGLALLYGATGSTELPAIASGFADGGVLSFAGLGLLLVGLAFKVGAVPFHMWTPDVYQGAPTAVTAFMSVGAKVGGFAAMIRFFASALPDSATATWVLPIAIISALTMILGNVVAVSQTDIKRLLAYSSIAHGGYILMAVAAIGDSDEAVSAALTYMMAYTFTNIGAFAIAIMLERGYGQGTDLEDYKGLAKNNLGLALMLAYFLFSLIGMPLTGGFIGKFVVIRSTLDAGLVWLAVIGVLTSAISAYYYLRVIFYMFMHDGDAVVSEPSWVNIAAGIALVATITIGFIPGFWINLANSAVSFSTQFLVAGF